MILKLTGPEWGQVADRLSVAMMSALLMELGAGYRDNPLYLNFHPRRVLTPQEFFTLIDAITEAGLEPKVVWL